MYKNINNVITALQNQKMVLLINKKNNQNICNIIFVAEFTTIDKINFCNNYCSGAFIVAISRDIKNRLTTNNVNNTPLLSIDACEKFGIKTGASPKEKMITLKTIANPNSKPYDFSKPGNIFPVVVKKYGILESENSEDSAFDLMKFAKLENGIVLCELRNTDGSFLTDDDIKQFMKQHEILSISFEEIKKYALQHSNYIELSSATTLPTEFGIFTISIYKNTINNIEHIVLQPNIINHKIKPFIRIHSECITGEVFCSLKCDCNQELKDSMKLLQTRENGAIIYLKDHEGRGISFGNKIKAYNLQDQELNTGDANIEIGFAIDEQNYNEAITILYKLGYKNFDLYTGNKDKINTLKDNGFYVDQIIPKIKITAYNHN